MQTDAHRQSRAHHHGIFGNQQIHTSAPPNNFRLHLLCLSSIIKPPFLNQIFTTPRPNAGLFLACTFTPRPAWQSATKAAKSLAGSVLTQAQDKKKSK